MHRTKEIGRNVVTSYHTTNRDNEFKFIRGRLYDIYMSLQCLVTRGLCTSMLVIKRLLDVFSRMQIYIYIYTNYIDMYL